ncbi:hypothetical protein B0I37DRAFT_358720 [Chaetomium sp. MPI-CAGE-AT-0009]|nr:hypothetical protein B0I37DRAFT_358720 [Chaetomium sp. MPI-CAGE-AT-0009]
MLASLARSGVGIAACVCGTGVTPHRSPRAGGSAWATVFVTPCRRRTKPPPRPVPSGLVHWQSVAFRGSVGVRPCISGRCGHLNWEFGPRMQHLLNEASPAFTFRREGFRPGRGFIGIWRATPYPALLPVSNCWKGSWGRCFVVLQLVLET